MPEVEDPTSKPGPVQEADGNPDEGLDPSDAPSPPSETTHTGSPSNGSDVDEGTLARLTTALRRNSGTVAGWAAAIVAGGSLLATVHHYRSEVKLREALFWQKAAVDEVLKDGPLEIDQIHVRYREIAQTEGFHREIPSQRLTKNDLKRVLIELMQMGIVGRNTRDEFFLLRRPPKNPQDEMFRIITVQAEQRRVESLVMEALSTGNSLTPDSLFQVVRSRTSLDRTEFEEVILNLSRTRLVERSRSNEVSISYDDQRAVEGLRPGVLRIWIPAADDTDTDVAHTAFADWLSANNDWWGRMRYNTLGADGWLYEMESPKPGSEVLSSDNPETFVTEKARQTFDLSDAAPIWTEID